MDFNQLRVTNYELRVTSYELRIAEGIKLRSIKFLIAEGIKFHLDFKMSDFKTECTSSLFQGSKKNLVLKS